MEAWRKNEEARGILRMMDYVEPTGKRRRMEELLYEWIMMSLLEG